MIKNVVIVGGGFGGWYTAAAVKHNFPDIKVIVVDSDKHPRLGVGETLGWSAPYDWRRHVGLEDDRELMFRTGAIYKYGLTVSDFWQDNKSFSYGKFFNLKISSMTKFYGGYDYPDFYEPWSKTQGDTGVQQAWLAINQRTDKDFTDYIAELNESSFFISNPVAPYDKKNDYVQRPNDGYSYHIDAEATVEFLKELALKGNVTHISSSVISADTDNGITGLHLENGQVLTADLFIDASGFARVLTKHCVNDSWHSLEGKFPDSAYVVPSRYTDPEKEMVGGTEIYGEDYGWRFRVTLYHRMGNGYIFNSTETDPEIPKKRLLELTEGTRFVEPKLIQWSPGFFETAWQNNVLSLGVAAAFIDPYDAPTFDIHSRDLEDLFRVLRGNDLDTARTDYNVQHRVVVEERNLRLLFNFGLSKRKGPFWDSRRALVAERMQDLRDILNEQKTDIEARLQHFWHQMYFRMVIATNTDRNQFNAVELSDSDRAMAQSFFDYNRARNKYIEQQTWPNYYQWLKENRFGGKSSEDVLKELHPQWAN
jgi:tryptophan halogenase